MYFSIEGPYTSQVKAMSVNAYRRIVFQILPGSRYEKHEDIRQIFRSETIPEQFEKQVQEFEGEIEQNQLKNQLFGTPVKYNSEIQLVNVDT